MELHKMYHENDENFFKAITKVTNDKFETTFIDAENNKAYKILVDKEIFDESANDIGKNSDDIKTWAIKAFSSQSTSEFTFNITEDGKRLIWKKSGKRKLRIAEIPLENVDYQEADRKMFEHALSEKELCERYKNNYEHVAEERKGNIQTMSKMVEHKKDLEQKMYGQFLPILNSKQDRIKELEERLKDLENKTETEEMEAKTAPKIVHEISDSDSEEEMVQENEPSSILQANASMNLNDSQNLLNF